MTAFHGSHGPRSVWSTTSIPPVICGVTLITETSNARSYGYERLRVTAPFRSALVKHFEIEPWTRAGVLGDGLGHELPLLLHPSSWVHQIQGVSVISPWHIELKMIASGLIADIEYSGLRSGDRLKNPVSHNDAIKTRLWPAGKMTSELSASIVLEGVHHVVVIGGYLVRMCVWIWSEPEIFTTLRSSIILSQLEMVSVVLDEYWAFDSID